MSKYQTSDQNEYSTLNSFEDKAIGLYMQIEYPSYVRIKKEISFKNLNSECQVIRTNDEEQL